MSPAFFGERVEMPVAGLVVCFLPEKLESVRSALERLEGVEVYGWNDKGEMVVVFEGETVDQMEKELKEWPRKIEGVLSINVAYFNVEDEVEKIERGEYVPERPWKA